MNVCYTLLWIPWIHQIFMVNANSRTQNWRNSGTILWSWRKWRYDWISICMLSPPPTEAQNRVTLHWEFSLGWNGSLCGTVGQERWRTLKKQQSSALSITGCFGDWNQLYPTMWMIASVICNLLHSKRFRSRTPFETSCHMDCTLWTKYSEDLVRRNEFPHRIWKPVL